MQQIGVVLLLIGIFAPVVVAFAHEFWWLIYCYFNGGDWKYYLHNVLGMLWVVSVFLGCLLILLGAANG